MPSTVVHRPIKYRKTLGKLALTRKSLSFVADNGELETEWPWEDLHKVVPNRATDTVPRLKITGTDDADADQPPIIFRFQTRSKMALVIEDIKRRIESAAASAEKAKPRSETAEKAKPTEDVTEQTEITRDSSANLGSSFSTSGSFQYPDVPSSFKKEFFTRSEQTVSTRDSSANLGSSYSTAGSFQYHDFPPNYKRESFTTSERWNDSMDNQSAREWNLDEEDPFKSVVIVTKTKPTKDADCGVSLRQSIDGNICLAKILPHGLFLGTSLEPGMPVVAINGILTEDMDLTTASLLLKKSQSDVTIAAYPLISNRVPFSYTENHSDEPEVEVPSKNQGEDTSYGHHAGQEPTKPSQNNHQSGGRQCGAGGGAGVSGSTVPPPPPPSGYPHRASTPGPSYHQSGITRTVNLEFNLQERPPMSPTMPMGLQPHISDENWKSFLDQADELVADHKASVKRPLVCGCCVIVGGFVVFGIGVAGFPGDDDTRASSSDAESLMLTVGIGLAIVFAGFAYFTIKAFIAFSKLKRDVNNLCNATSEANPGVTMHFREKKGYMYFANFIDGNGFATTAIDYTHWIEVRFMELVPDI